MVDAHAHDTHLLPAPIQLLHRAITRGQPRGVDLGELRRAGVDAIVAAPVGDRLVTRFRWPASPWEAVLRALERIRTDAVAGGCELATASADISPIVDRGHTAVFLGLEGADTLAEDLGRASVLHDRGVRVVGVMHYADSPFGTICMDFAGGPAGAEVAAGRARGLTLLGRELVAELEARHMLVDVAHADAETTADICALASRPVIASHTGARSLDDFPRYLPDHLVESVAATGGLVGLWPYHGRGHGMASFDDFARHAEHIAGLVGARHLCIGTDMNGVPSLIEGYEGPQHIPQLIAALERIGFSGDEIDGIVGGNLIRLL